MIKPPSPANDASRVAALRALGVLDTPPEERFERYTRLARRLFGVETVLVSLVDADRQWFKSRVGLAATQTSRTVSFCAHAINCPDETLIVPNALEDERFHDNPLVVGEPGIRFYAGHPLRTSSGHALGTFCLIDGEGRTLSDEDRGLLADLASLVVRELEGALAATTDPLTGLTNRRGFEVIAGTAFSGSVRRGHPATLLYLDLDDFKSINDSWGHAQGDAALQEVARVLVSTFRESDVVARLGGDEFCVLCTGTDAGVALELGERLQTNLERANAERDSGWSVSASLGAVALDPERHASVADLLAEADAIMYSKKRPARS